MNRPDLQEAAIPRQPGETQRLLVAGLAAAGILILLAFPLLRGRFSTANDLAQFSLPLKVFYAHCLEQGDDFTWCPLLFGGFYLHGEGQLGMMHPAHWLAYKWLPFAVAYNLELWIHYPLLLAGTYFLLRRWKLPRDAALFGGMAFAFSGFTIMHIVHLNALGVICHIPWMLGCVDIIWRSASQRALAGAGLALALLTASQILLGYPQYVLFTGILLGLYVIFLAREGIRLSRLFAASIAVVLGGLAGSIQLLPTWEALGMSDRADPASEFQYAFSLDPLNILQLLSPYGFNGRVYGGNPHEFALYTGAAITVLCVWAVAKLNKLGSLRPIALGGLGLALLGFVLALGKNGGLYTYLAYLPVFGAFRCPCRYILFVHLGMAIMAAVAFVDMTRCAGTKGGKEPRAVWWMVVASLLVCVVVLLLGSFGHRKVMPRIAAPEDAVLGAVLIIAAAALTAAGARGYRSAVVGLIVFAAVDIAAYGWLYLDPSQQQALAEHTRVPPGNGRVYWKSNQFVLNGSKNLLGYAGLTPRKMLDPLCGNTLRACNVAWLSVDGAHGVVWEPVRDTVPYVRLVALAVHSIDPAGDIESIDVATTALVDEPLELPAGDCGSATLTLERPGHLAIETDATLPRLLVVAESMHPGWCARIDGQLTRVMPVYGDLMGCVVPSGKHQVQWIFEPASLRAGAQLSAIGLALILVVFVTSWFVKIPQSRSDKVLATGETEGHNGADVREPMLVARDLTLSCHD